MKIVFDKDIPGLSTRLKASARGIETLGLASTEITKDVLKDADALVVRTRTRCDAAMLGGTGVKLVATATVGTDHIDCGWCEANGIEVSNAPGCNAPAVMQYVAASLAYAGFNPEKQTLGVVGKGNIGSLVVRLYREAGGRVLVCDPLRAEAGEKDEEYVDLTTLLSQSDAVTFHVPLTTEDVSSHPTLGLLNAENVMLLHEGGIIVNASRGGVVEEKVIRHYCSRYRMIIDTWPGEEEKKGVKEDLIGKPFISTPHIAGYSREGKERATRAVIEAINSKFALDIPADELADFGFWDRLPALEQVISSYNPLSDSSKFKQRPGEIDTLRNNYKLREEA